MSRTILVAMVAGALVGPGCHSPSGSSEDVRLMVDASPRQTTATQPTTVSVVLRNLRSDEARLGSGSACWPSFEVQDSSGRPVPSGQVCILRLDPHVLAPGESRVRSYTWVPADAEGRPLPPGRYTVYGVVDDQGGRRLRSASGVIVTVR